jgi:hypothetical protein
MSKKLMLLAAGALTALAFAALPAVASAGTYNVDCEGGAPTCGGTITSNPAVLIELEDDAGVKIRCTSTTGSFSATNATSTGSAELVFKGCTEQTFDAFKCNNTGVAGEIKTNKLTSDLINIDPSPATTPGILLTGINVTFTCAGFVNKTVTGNIIGHIENGAPGGTACDTIFDKTTSISFEKIGVGQQKFKQVTTTGTMFDLISGDHTSGAKTDATTSSQTGTGILNWTTSARITC